MKLLYHGAKCCGVKHIEGLEYKPGDISYEQRAKTAEERKKAPTNADAYGHSVSSDQDRFFDGAPTETCEDRLRRLIRYVARYRESNIIEVIVAYRCDENGEIEIVDNYGIEYYWNQHHWLPALEKIGFKSVTKAFNSNSNNVCDVHHLVLFKGKIQMPDGSESDPEDFDLKPSKEEIEKLAKEVKPKKTAASQAFRTASSIEDAIEL